MRSGVVAAPEFLNGDPVFAAAQNGSLASDLDSSVSEPDELQTVRPLGDVIPTAVLVGFRRSEVEPVHSLEFCQEKGI